MSALHFGITVSCQQVQGPLDPAGMKAIGADTTASQLADRQVLMVLDTSAWAQLGPMGDVVRGSSARKMILDTSAKTIWEPRLSRMCKPKRPASWSPGQLNSWVCR